jgi:hypothetical protein
LKGAPVRLPSVRDRSRAGSAFHLSDAKTNSNDDAAIASASTIDPLARKEKTARSILL